MRIFAISDTHKKHYDINVPECDVFVCAGDFTNFGDTYNNYINFNRWLGEIRANKKIVVGGNHDELLYKDKNILKHLNNCIYLEDKEIVIDGYKFYGTPWEQWYYEWLFSQGQYKDIPNDIDVLITHTPPYQIYDIGYDGRNFGCKHLLDKVFKIQPKFHIFGHVHCSGGRHSKIGNTYFYNVAKSFDNNGMIIDI